MPLLTQLADSFTSTALNPGLWGASTGGAVTLDTVNNRAVVACPTGAGQTNALASAGPWDARGQSLYARILPVPKGSGGTATRLVLTVDASNSITVQLTGGQSTFQAVVTNAGVTTTAALPAYDPYLHAWWRVRESGGTWYVDTAPDGYTWTQQATLTATWTASAVQVAFQASTATTETYTGLTASVGYINTLSGEVNPGYPRMQHAWGAVWGAGGATVPTEQLVDMTKRVEGQQAETRGRQYELDQTRAGELTIAVTNKDGSLDPTNSSGPWYGHITPYQPWRHTAQWPPSNNLLPQAVASAGDLGGYPTGTIPAALALHSTTDTTGGSIVATAAAWQGGRVFAFAVPNTAGAADAIVSTGQVPAERGTTYSAHLRIRNTTASSSVSVRPFLSFPGVSGSGPITYGTTQVLTGSATAAWTYLSVTATAPDTAASMSIGVALNGAPAAACTVQVDGWQAEAGPVPTQWACPGVTYPMYAGFIERWPQSWTLGGTYGMVSAPGVDAFALLSQDTLDAAFPQYLSTLGPRFVYPLSDPAGATSFAEANGAYVPAPLINSKYGAGSLTGGNAITAATPAGVFTGAGDATVVTIQNPNPGTNTPSPASLISLDRAGIKGPASASWTRAIAFRYYGTGPYPDGAGFYLWSAFDAQRVAAGPNGAQCCVSVVLVGAVSPAGSVNLNLQGPGSGTFVSLNAGSNTVDGNWHLIVFGYDAPSGTMSLTVDGVTATKAISASSAPTGIVRDTVGGYLEPTGTTSSNFWGDVAFALEIPRTLTAAEQATLYSAWRSAWSGESTGARYAHILAAAGYTGPTAIDTGNTASMGPADTAGKDVVTCLQDIVDTEGGEHFVARDGTITFRSRGRRYNALTPVWTLGERADLGEIPYDDCSLDYDPTRVGNDASVTQTSTGQVFSARDAASIATYFRRTLTRNVNSTDPGECQDAASYLVSRYRQPAVRVNQVVLHPSANPGLLWPVCLSLELGMRLRVMRRPNGAPPIQVDVFLEGIAWDFDGQGDAHVTLQLSPADLTPYGIVAAWHTTLASSYAAGVSTLTINAGQDNTNLLAAQIGQGQQLIIGLGTANQETVTVQGVGVTTPGWTTSFLSLLANTTKPHTAGEIVCELLPAGVTDPTIYDAGSAFDASAFAY